MIPIDKKILQAVSNLELISDDLKDSGIDAILTSYGPLLVGDARFSVPFSEARYRSLINRLGIVVLELTVTGKIIYCNEITSQLTGIPVQNLLDSSCFEVIKPFDFNTSDQLRVDFINNSELIDYQTKLVSVDGNNKIISWNTFDIFGCDHQLERIVYFGIDISEQKLSEQNLAIAGIAFETNLPMTICAVDGTILRVNAAFTKLTGYEEIEVIGQDCNMLDSPANTIEFYNLFKKTIKDTGEWAGELWSQRKNGDVYQEYLTVSAVKNTHGYITHYVSTYQDISLFNVYKLGLIEAKEKAERFSTLKSQFIASMSHEIRTPMTAIIGFSELALYQDMSAKVKGYVEKINIAATSLLGILEDILNFTKLEAGCVSIEAIPFNILDLLGFINTLFSGSAQQKGLTFTITRDNLLPYELVGDKLRLQQVLINLVGNAVKFTSQGDVKLNVTLQVLTPLHVQILFSVSDTGIGISLADQHKLFIEFSQVDGSISRQYGGTGLGLVISKELVTLMGGEISVVSDIGQGSTFSFSLQFPLINNAIGYTDNLTESTETTHKKLDSTMFKGRRILVVDDNQATQLLLHEYLNELGAEIVSADNGLEAMEHLELQHFDAVLMDIHMPIVNGLEATRLIQRQRRFAELPIIALSAGVTEEERNNCMNAGMTDFICKPININDLCRSLTLWLKPRV